MNKLISAHKRIYPFFLQSFKGKVNKKLFFLHIPKCGGTAIDIAMRNSYGLYNNLRAKSLFQLNQNALLKASSIYDEPIEDYKQKLLLYYLSNSDCKYISGHFRYSERAMEEFGNHCQFITILRSPVSQWFSLYFFNRYKQSPRFKLHEDLESFIESEAALHLGSSYVYKLTDNISWNEASSEKAIEQAIENLNKFALVGILEKMDSFIKDYETLFGGRLLIQKYNQNPLSKSQQKEPNTEEIKNKVKEICQPNLRVYESIVRKIK